MADGARFCIRQRRGWPAAIGRKGTRMAVSLDKVQRQAPGLLPLAKKADDKVREYGLDGERAKFALVLDYSSGPMRRKYDNDSMQRLAEKVIALATRFNDDGVIDVFLFGSKAWHAGPLGIDDYENGINRLIGGKAMGGTDYDYAFDKVLDYYGSDTASTRTIEKKGLLGRTRIVKARGGAGPLQSPRRPSGVRRTPHRRLPGLGPVAPGPTVRHAARRVQGLARHRAPRRAAPLTTRPAHRGATTVGGSQTGWRGAEGTRRPAIVFPAKRTRF